MSSLGMFWVALSLTLGVLAVAVPMGGSLRLAQATLILLLPHLFIGDLFHWSRFPRLRTPEKTRWVSLAVLGFVVFLCIRQAGDYAFPLFYVYFFGHFWKDFLIPTGRCTMHEDPEHTISSFASLRIAS